MSVETDAIWMEFARELVRKHPDQLEKPDFEGDGNARFIWSVAGFTIFQKLMHRLGELTTVKIGEKTFDNFPMNSREDQIYIARQAFIMSSHFWPHAKQEADEQKERERRSAALHEDLSTQIAAADTLRQLDIVTSKIRALIDKQNGEDAATLRIQLERAQNRQIELERKNSRSNKHWAIAGFVVGAIGLIFGAIGIAIGLMSLPPSS